MTGNALTVIGGDTTSLSPWSLEDKRPMAVHDAPCAGRRGCAESKPACIDGRGLAHHFVLKGSRPNYGGPTLGKCRVCALIWIFGEWSQCRYAGYGVRVREPTAGV
jgi:hypothetical protein